MTRQELLDYVKVLFELEHQIYTYRELKRSYEKRIEELGKIKIHTVQMEYDYNKSAPYYHILYNSAAWHNCDDFQNCDMTIACGEIDGKIIKNQEWYHTKECQDFMNSRIKQLQPIKAKKKFCEIIITVSVILMLLAFVKSALVLQLGTDNPYFMIGCMFGCIALFVLFKKQRYLVPHPDAHKTDMLNEFYSKKFDEYFKENYEYNYQSQRQKMKKELNETIIPHIDETKRLRDYLYSKNIIFPKYRNLVAMAQIYEYLLSGRSSSLEGPHGAYNLFENELRLNIIIDKLDIIIDKLNSLGASMSVLCGAINTTNSLLSNINSSINTYNAQCVAYNANIANQYRF